MRRADRLLQIIQILRRHRRPVAGQKIAQELEVSLRTIYRDIETLMIEGVPITGEAGVGYVLGEGYDLPPLMFRADEIEAIILGLHWVKTRADAALVHACDDAIAKIGVILPQSLKGILFDPSILVPPQYGAIPDNIDVAAIRAAIRAKNKVQFDYVREDGASSRRTIWPLAISYFDRQRLIIGWCETRADFRAFRTDRANGLEILPEKYRESRMALLKTYITAMKARRANFIAQQREK